MMLFIGWNGGCSLGSHDPSGEGGKGFVGNLVGSVTLLCIINYVYRYSYFFNKLIKSWSNSFLFNYFRHYNVFHCYEKRSRNYARNLWQRILARKWRVKYAFFFQAAD